MNQASLVVVPNPMAVHEAVARTVPAGSRIRDLAPESRFPPVCRLDGQWILRAEWERELQEGQVVEFHVYPQGGGGGGSDVGRTLLMIAAIYVAAQFGGPALASVFGKASTAVAVFAATTLVNALVPVKVGSDGVSSGGGSVSPTYTTGLSGNQFRLEEAIPVLFGRNKTFPSFAAEPYIEYSESGNDDQYYYALFCLGQGQYDIESMLIDDTNIGDFSDVQRVILPPGTLPTLVSANIVAAPEVTGNELTAGKFVGPFIGCRAKSKANEISIDITCSRGLATYDAAGNPGNMAVSWQVQYRAVDDFGNPSFSDSPGNWTILETETLTLAQTKPVRRTYKYGLPSNCRPQVRLVRTTPFNDNSRVANTVEWAGLRCHLTAPAPLSAIATHIEIVMKASEQLSGLTQRKVAVISRRLLRKWHPDTGWTAVQETRNPAWALADKWTNAVYGDGYADSRCDLQTLYDLSLVWDARQDRFDAVFDQTYDSFAADQMIAQAGRAAVFRRNGLMTLTRDQLRGMPVTAFTARNIQPGSVSIKYGFCNEATPDGVIVEYRDNRSWDWVDILVPAPGVVTPVRPQRLKLFGVTGATHALRDGLYHMANSYYRRKFPSFSTELEGMIPHFGSAVVFAPSLPGWGKLGDVVSFTLATKLLVVSEPLAWTSAAKHYISFLNRNGSLTIPYEVTRGADDYSAYFSVTPAAVISADYADEERTKYVFGAGTPYPQVLRVLFVGNSAAGDDGVKNFQISGVVEDDRVHTADVAYLPADGVVQDPVDVVPGTGGGGAGGGDDGPPSSEYVVYLKAFTPPDGVPGYQYPHSLIKFQTDGKALLIYESSFSYTPAGWWILGAGPYDSAVTGLFEIRLVLVSQVGDLPLGDSLDTWLSLSSERVWYHLAIGVGSVYETLVNIEIRSAATQIVLERYENFQLFAYGPPGDGTGGGGG